MVIKISSYDDLERVLQTAELGSEELLDAVELACDWIFCGMLAEEFLDNLLTYRTSVQKPERNRGKAIEKYVRCLPICQASSSQQLEEWYRDVFAA